MNTTLCVDCGRELVVKKKVPPMRCQRCHLAFYRRTSPLQCIDCGKELNPKSARITKRCLFCFIKSHSTKFKEPDYDDSFGHWLAGFTDGEGNFSCITGHGQCFRINLREDDKPILEEMRLRLGCGRIYFLKKTQYDSCRRDQYQFSVACMVDLVNIIIPFFDKYPLRAKKRFDYLQWRENILSRWSILSTQKGVMQGG